MTTPKFKNKLNIQKIHSLFFSLIKPSFKDSLEHHKYWEFVYVNRGEISVRCENEITTLSEGELIIHPPHQNHKIESCLFDKTKITICSFLEDSNLLYKLENYKITLNTKQKNIIKDILSELVVPSKDVIFEHILSMPALSYMPKDIKIDREGSLRNQCIKNYLEILLLSFIRNLYEEKREKSLPSKNENDKATCQNIISYMQDNLSRNLTLKEMCRVSCIGKTVLTKLFKEGTSKGVIEYFIYLKIEKAKSLLSDTDMSINEISKMLNFSSQNYFSRVFKSQTGLTPTCYKKSLKTKA